MEDEAQPFSLGAFLIFPSYLFSSLWSRRSWQALVSALHAFFIEGEILQKVMLPGHHNLWKPPRNDGKNVRVGLPDNYKQVSSI